MAYKEYDDYIWDENNMIIYFSLILCAQDLDTFFLVPLKYV